MKSYYFTFGFDRSAHGYVTIDAESEEEARQEMIHHYGRKWAFTYSAEEFRGQVEKYRLKEVAHIYFTLLAKEKRNNVHPNG